MNARHRVLSSGADFHCCDAVSACRSGEVLPVCSMHLHSSQSTFTPGWQGWRQAVNWQHWLLGVEHTVPQSHTPSRLPSFVSWGWGWGLNDQLFGHCWWESRFCFTNSRAHRVYRKPKVTTHSVSLNSELSGHCWHLKSSHSKTIVWNFFQRIYPREKAKDKNTQTGVWLGGSPVLSICKALCSNLGEKKDITSNYRCPSVDLGKATKVDRLKVLGRGSLVTVTPASKPCSKSACALRAACVL